jgi:hypothetical protein
MAVSTRPNAIGWTARSTISMAAERNRRAPNQSRDLQGAAHSRLLDEARDQWSTEKSRLTAASDSTTARGNWEKTRPDRGALANVPPGLKS